HLHDDEAEIGQGRKALLGTERLGNERSLRSRINLFDHRISLGRIKTLWPTDDAPDVGLSVAPLGRENFGGFPIARLQFGDVCLFQLANELAIARTTQLMN